MFGCQLMAFRVMFMLFYLAERTLKCEYPIDVLSLFESLSSSSPPSFPLFVLCLFLLSHVIQCDKCSEVDSFPPSSFFMKTKLWMDKCSGGDGRKRKGEAGTSGGGWQMKLVGEGKGGWRRFPAFQDVSQWLGTCAFQCLRGDPWPGTGGLQRQRQL